MKWTRALLAGALMTSGLAVAAPQAAAPGLPALATIERGQWLLRSQTPGVANRSICISDPQILLQLHHPGQRCSRFVVENTSRSVTVQYDCGGRGNGRTGVTVETGRLVTLDVQGIEGGMPFTEQYEGRRTGACTAAAR